MSTTHLIHKGKYCVWTVTALLADVATFYVFFRHTISTRKLHISQWLNSTKIICLSLKIFSFENALSFELKAKWPNSIQLNQYIKNTAHKGLCSILFIEFYCSISNEPLWWLAALTPFIHWEKQGDFSSSVIGLIKLVAFVATTA